VADGRLYGRGSYDMKGGAAAAMLAAAELARAAPGLPGRLLVALLADEEHASLGAQHFVARHDADGCILTEPSEGRLLRAHKGFLWLEVVTRGRAAHGSRWDLGRSAIAAMAPIVAALTRFDDEVLRRRSDPWVGPASLHAATIRGGAGLSTYAEECVLGVERRTLPGEPAAAALAELRALVASVDPAAEVRELLARPPLDGATGAALAAVVSDAARAVTGQAPEEAGVGFWTDAAFFSGAGIPTVDYGPTGEGAHAAVEWVDLASVAVCRDVLVEAARRFLGAGRGERR
jgi:acetylornithine deacetylase